MYKQSLLDNFSIHDLRRRKNKKSISLLMHLQALPLLALLPRFLFSSADVKIVNAQAGSAKIVFCIESASKPPLLQLSWPCVQFFSSTFLFHPCSTGFVLS